MRDFFYKVLPIVVGVLVGWLVVSPPEFLGLPTLLRIALVVPLAAGGLLFFFLFLITASLPEKISLTPVEQHRVTDEMIDLFNAYRGVGLDLAGAPLKVGVNPPAVLVPLVDREARMYGTIFRTGTAPPKTACDFVTLFQPEGGLTTGAAVEGASLPSPPGSFHQVFPGADVGTLHRKHLEALAWLQSRGVSLKPATAAAFPTDFQKSIARLRKHFLSRPLWHTLVVIWRSSTGQSPNLGPIMNQAVAQTALLYLRGDGNV